MKHVCSNCGVKLGVRAFQYETRRWVATGKFPTHDFCGLECGAKWYRRVMKTPEPPKAEVKP